MKPIRNFLVAAAALSLSACSFEVSNPGPLPDDVLDANGAYSAIVLGVRYNLSRAQSVNAYYSAVAAKEYSTAGRVISTKLPSVLGQLTVDDISANMYNWSQAARWQAEDGVRRLRDVLGTGFNTNPVAARLLMFVALTNRVLGENFCEAVIDGGVKEANSVYFDRAETAANEAIAVATAIGASADSTRFAALAVRATARLYKGNFAGAAADAALVANTFSLSAPYDETIQNIIVQANDFAVGGSFRATSVWRSFFDNYYRTTGDQRVWWDSTFTATGAVAVGEITTVRWYFPRKYIPTRTTTDRGQPIKLISGREMRLIQAEVFLRAGDFASAAPLINGLRTGVAVRTGSAALSPWTITNVREGWNALRKERSIELWLEARTMGDLRRWIADGTYKSQFDITPAGTGINGSPDNVADRIRLCFPISRGERNTNANLSLTPDDPTSSLYVAGGAAAVW